MAALFSAFEYFSVCDRPCLRQMRLGAFVCEKYRRKNLGLHLEIMVFN